MIISNIPPEAKMDILDKEETKKLIARLGVQHCYLAPSDVQKARYLLLEYVSQDSGTANQDDA